MWALVTGVQTCALPSSGRENGQEGAEARRVDGKRQPVSQVLVRHCHWPAVGLPAHHAFAALSVIALATPRYRRLIRQQVILRPPLAGHELPPNQFNSSCHVALDDFRLGKAWDWRRQPPQSRSEEHTSELQSLMRISYAVFCLKKKIHQTPTSLNIFYHY